MHVFAISRTAGDLLFWAFTILAPVGNIMCFLDNYSRLLEGKTKIGFLVVYFLKVSVACFGRFLLAIWPFYCGPFGEQLLFSAKPRTVAVVKNM